MFFSQKSISSRGQNFLIRSRATILILGPKSTLKYRLPLNSHTSTTQISFLSFFEGLRPLDALACTYLLAFSYQLPDSSYSGTSPQSSAASSGCLYFTSLATSDPSYSSALWTRSTDCSYADCQLCSSSLSTASIPSAFRPLRLRVSRLLSRVAGYRLYLGFCLLIWRVFVRVCRTTSSSSCFQYSSTISRTFSKFLRGSHVACVAGQPTHLIRYSGLPALLEVLPLGVSRLSMMLSTSQPPSISQQLILNKNKHIIFKGVDRF